MQTRTKRFLSVLGLFVLAGQTFAVPAALAAPTKRPAPRRYKVAHRWKAPRRSAAPKSAAVKRSGVVAVVATTAGGASKSAPAAARLVAVAAAETVGAAAPSGEKRVSLDFVGADINDVLKALALQADVNIVSGADVKGVITVSLTRVTVPEALDMVARLSGFQYARIGPAFVVGSEKSVAALGGGSAPAPAPTPITQFIPYRFVRTSDLGRALDARFPDLQRIGGGGDDKAAATDEKANPSQPRLLALSGAPERVAEARAFVTSLDQAATFPAAGAITEVYRVRYAAPVDLVVILSRLVPTVQAQLGPSQGFQSGSTGASASFASAGPAGGASAAGSSPSAATSGGAGTANPAGAVASGSAPTTLLLTGAAEDLARARQTLDQVDVRAPQMQFEARVVDINNVDLSKIGLSYDFNNGGNGIRLGEPNQGNPPTILTHPTGARQPNFGSILRTPYSIGASLDLLAQNNKARILASPNLSALDGQPAVVFIGDQLKYVISIQQTPQGQNIQTETATVGITLKVTGKASPDGTITLYVHPEVSVISSYLDVGNGISLPQIASRFVDTTIRVKDGETIGIGGLIRESDITNIQKVPFFGDLPFFGQLFKRTEKNKQRSEIVIFITSRVLKD